MIQSASTPALRYQRPTPEALPPHAAFLQHRRPLPRRARLHAAAVGASAGGHGPDRRAEVLRPARRAADRQDDGAPGARGRVDGIGAVRGGADVDGGRGAVRRRSGHGRERHPRPLACRRAGPIAARSAATPVAGSAGRRGRRRGAGSLGEGRPSPPGRVPRRDRRAGRQRADLGPATAPRRLPQPADALPVVAGARRLARRARLQGRRRPWGPPGHRQPLQCQGRVADPCRLHARRRRRAVSAAHRRHRPVVHAGRGRSRLRADARPAVVGQRPGAAGGGGPGAGPIDAGGDGGCRGGAGPVDPAPGHPPGQPGRAPARAARAAHRRADAGRDGAARRARGRSALRRRPGAVPARLGRRAGHRQPDLRRHRPPRPGGLGHRVLGDGPPDVAGVGGADRRRPPAGRVPRLLAAVRPAAAQGRALPRCGAADGDAGLPAPRGQRRRRDRARVRHRHGADRPLPELRGGTASPSR